MKLSSKSVFRPLARNGCHGQTCLPVFNRTGSRVSCAYPCHPSLPVHRATRLAICVASVALLAATSCTSLPRVAAPKGLAQAHAHNDYEHARPLLDALDHGFCSGEADIHLVDGELLIAHDAEDVRADRTLQKLYLDPLRKRIRANRGRVHRDQPAFHLLIDIKTAGEPTYRALHDVLAHYADMLTTYRNGQIETKPVSVVISGNRPWSVVAAQPVRYVGVDGRLADLDGDKPAHLMPLVSDNWRSHFRWRGQGPFPQAERDKLHDAVRRAHDKGCRIRFWATPDVPAAWHELQAAGADMINTDDLDGLQRFLTGDADR